MDWRKKKKMETPEDRQAVLTLQYQTSVALLENLKRQMQFFSKMLEIQLKVQISRMNTIPPLTIDGTTCDVSGYWSFEFQFQEKLQSINESITAFYRSAMACTERLTGLGSDVQFFVDHLTKLAQKFSIEEQGTRREKVEGRQAKEGTPTRHSPVARTSRAPLLEGPAVNKSSFYEGHSLTENFVEASKARSAVQRVHHQERTIKPNPYSPESEKKRKERKQDQDDTSPSKSPTQRGKNEFSINKKPKVEFDTSGNYKIYKPKGGPTVKEKGELNIIPLKKGTPLKMRLSTQTEEIKNTTQPEEEFFVDSDTEYANLSDVERTSSDTKEKYDSPNHF